MKAHSVHAIAAAALIGTIVAACGPSTVDQANPVAPPTGLAISLKTDDVIARDQARLRQHPDDWKSVDELAAAYLQKVRERAYTVTDAEVEALKAAGLSEDEIFEQTVAVAVDEGLRRLDAAARVLG